MTEVKQVTIYLSPSDHKELKIISAKNDTTISNIIQELVKKYIREEKHENV